MPAGTDEAKLRTLFEPFGEILSIAVQKDTQNALKGSGFVSFKDPNDAMNALNNLNKKLSEDGTYLLVSQHISKKENEVSSHGKQAPIGQALAKSFDSNLFIKNIPTGVSEDKIKEVFEKCGNVISVKFRVNPHI
jgi:RNA recognition motif-containing protein